MPFAIYGFLIFQWILDQSLLEKVLPALIIDCIAAVGSSYRPVGAASIFGHANNCELAKRLFKVLVPDWLMIYRLRLANTVLQSCFSTNDWGTSTSLKAGAMQNSVPPIAAKSKTAKPSISRFCYTKNDGSTQTICRHGWLFPLKCSSLCNIGTTVT